MTLSAFIHFLLLDPAEAILDQTLSASALVSLLRQSRSNARPLDAQGSLEQGFSNKVCTNGGGCDCLPRIW